MQGGEEVAKFVLSTRFFPSILIALDILSAVRYAVAGDLRHCLYWIAAATLTATVTF